MNDGEYLFEGNDDKIHAPWIGKWLIFHNLYNGLLYMTRVTLDTIVREARVNKTHNDVYALIEDMIHNHY